MQAVTVKDEGWQNASRTRYSMSRLGLIEKLVMPILAQVDTKISLPVNAVFEKVVHMDVPHYFTGRWPIASVHSVREQIGHWNQVGETRKIHLSDGTHLTERITSYQVGDHFAYELGDLTGALNVLVEKVKGVWKYEEVEGDTTIIKWRYDFYPKNVIIQPITWLFVKLLWLPYMNQVMNNIAEGVGKEIR